MLNPVDPAFLETLAAQLSDGVIGAVEPQYLADPRGRIGGQAGAVARPRDVREVATIIAACAKARVGVIPFGGGTGLVLGQVQDSGPLPLVLSLERMRAVCRN